MKKVKIYYSSKFAREYKKLPREIKSLAEEKELVFRSNPHASSLKTHKLTGKLKNYWSFSLDYKYRIIFQFVSDKEIWFLSIGDHDIYR